MIKLKNLRIHTASFFLMATLALSISCKEESTGQNDSESYIYQLPLQVNDGWEVAHVNQAGINQDLITRMMVYLGNSQHRIHNILIVKDNKLVFEEYFDGYLYGTNPPGSDGPFIKYGRETLHFLASVSKSVTSVLVGIAVDEGYITSVTDKITKYFPHYSHILVGEKADITVENLLTMTSGLAWDESSYPYGDSRNDVTQLFNSTDPIEFILEKQLTSTPGTSFHYNSGNTNVLAEIIRLKSGYNLKTFAEKYLFSPLGITNYKWDILRGDYVFASGGLYLSPRDLAKIGSLFLTGGKWNEQQIISQNWIDASKIKYISTSMIPYSTGYGYQWWLGSMPVASQTYNYFNAAGWGEQYMFILPSRNMLVVINSGYFLTNTTVSPFNLLKNYVLSALSN